MVYKLAFAACVVGFSAASAAAAQSLVTIPAQTPVVVQIEDPISTKTAKRGGTFRIHLAEPVVVNGVTLLPAGTPGGGEIVQSARAGIMGNPAELILAARYLDHGGVRIPLSKLRFAEAGKDNTQLAMAFSVALGWPLIAGGNIDVAAGTNVTARIAADVHITPPPAGAAPPAPVPSPEEKAP